MVKYQLKTGKTIFITVDQWLDMTDEKEQEYMAKDAGYEINDPFSEPNYREFISKGYNVPNIDEHIESLDEDSVNEIKKEIDDSE